MLTPCAGRAGVDAVGALLALVLAPAQPQGGGEALQAAALQLLLAPGLDLLSRLSTAPLVTVRSSDTQAVPRSPRS